MLPITSASSHHHPIAEHEHRGAAKRAVLPPTVSGTPEVLGVVSDPTLNRDSCTSVRVGGDGARSLWTCRDSSNYGSPLTFFVSSTASWTESNADGTPKVADGVLSMRGANSAPYFPIGAPECGPSGNCADGSRYAIWPDSAPLPVPTTAAGYALYTWINHAHIRGITAVETNLATTLYRSDVSADLASGAAGDSADADVLPPVTVVDDAFWPAGGIAYGSYGSVVDGDTAYLYGKLNSSSTGVALAKVPVASIEDKSAYRYYHGGSGTWGDSAAAIGDGSAAVPRAGTGGQGTFYYSAYFGAFVWIGGAAIFPSADFYVATAPAPEGPWSEPALFYSGELGTGPLPAYSLQAHPGLSADAGNGNDIYLTYTKVDDVYSTPLIRVVWA
ncbi:hypothetical protein SLS62_006988 [Diatrype stigma]|uniref:DUF4185 domain-containing protein n=1 Tax=Diatrype stigma TaxID=117547 RepID=A0AAN9UNU6_9PEZI